MSFTRIRISKVASTRLNIMKARTGLTPNILSRLAICFSLNEPRIPDPSAYDEQGQEFNRYTLTGEWDLLFIALLKERLVKDGLNPTLDLLPQFKAHLNRGVLSIYTRIHSLTDLYDLLPKGQLKDTHERESLEKQDDS